MSKAAYVRVSTAEQNEARQREALAVRGIDKWFIEKASGKNTDRPEFQKMLDWVREGDTIYIHDLSRIARSTKDLLDLLERQREGIAIAKREGKYKGRKAVTVPDLPRHYERYQRREVSKAALARELGISRPTLDRLFSDYNSCATEKRM